MSRSPLAQLTPAITRRNLLTALAASLVAPACGTEPKWTVHRSGEGKYRVELPWTPKTQKHVAQSSHGELPLVVTSCTYRMGTFSASYVDYPKAALFSPREVLVSAMTGAHAQLGGELTRQKPLELGRHPGLEYEVRFGRAWMATGRYYLVSPRVYHLDVVQPEKEHDPAVNQRFFDSFSL